MSGETTTLFICYEIDSFSARNKKSGGTSLFVLIQMDGRNFFYSNLYNIG